MNKKIKIRTAYSDISGYHSNSGNGMKTLLYEKIKKGEMYCKPQRDKNGKLVYENKYKLIQQFKSGCDYKTLLAQANGDPENIDSILNVNREGQYADLRQVPNNIEDFQEKQKQLVYEAYMKQLKEIEAKAKAKVEVKQTEVKETKPQENGEQNEKKN